MSRTHWKSLPEGSRYGSLVVMKRPSGNLLESYENLCQCDCGRRAIITSHMLATGKQTDCGCVFRDRKRNDMYPERLKGLDNLANAIMHRAALDYHIAFTRYLKKGNPSALADLRRFFRSDWCEVLTDLDAEVLMNRIEQECIIEYARKEKKKHGNQ